MDSYEPIDRLEFVLSSLIFCVYPLTIRDEFCIIAVEFAKYEFLQVPCKFVA